MKKAAVLLLVLGAAGGALYWYYGLRPTAPAFTVATSAVTRGDVVDTVGATGTVQAVTTVQVGTQVSGTIQSLGADFNSLVAKGQVLARLDPSLFQTQIEQARANLIRAQADLERLRVSLDDMRTKLARARELSGRQLIPKSDLDTAEVNVRLAEAQIRSSEAQVTQAQASLSQNEVNLQHTVIEAPIDGLVISRSVDVGQTVAASMQAPTLFLLAADLTKMQVVANLDESDVGRIRPGQAASFRVDAYPEDTFLGTVVQVRLEPKVAQNVVTYATVINVPNNELKLKPGMTANVTIEIARSTNVLRIPNGALRFRPTNEMFAALGQTPPDPASLRLENGGRGRGGAGPAAVPATPSAPAVATPPVPASAAPPTQLEPSVPRQRRGNAGTAEQAPAAGAGQGNVGPPAGPGSADADAVAGTGRGRGGRGRGDGTSGFGRGGRGGLSNGRENLSPEQRAQILQRMRGRGAEAAAPGSGTAPAGQRGARSEATPSPSVGSGAARGSGGATTIDALFGPLPAVQSQGRVWLHVDGQLRPIRVRLGLSDGQATALLEGDVQEGTELVTNVATGAATRPALTTTGGSIFGQPGRQGGFPGGGGGFPGGGGGTRGGGGGR